MLSVSVDEFFSFEGNVRNLSLIFISYVSWRYRKSSLTEFTA